MQTVTVLGATGSIGCNTLDVINRHPEKYRVFAITGNSQLELLMQQAQKCAPRFVVIADDTHYKAACELASHYGVDAEILTGSHALEDVSSAPEVDAVMAAIVGAAGLLPTLAAVKAGKRVLLANKEALVMSGKLFIDAANQSGAKILPIDSEHNAIFQSMPADYAGNLKASGIRKILLTASGGPFRGRESCELADVTPSQAVAHPNWSMGAKISVDSATLMNKGLELIEACFLFNCDAADVEVVVHPESVIHSMVQYCDGSVLAQLGQPDMRTPIAYGMAWPERIEAGVEPLNLFDIARLNFEAPDEKNFPCLALARIAFAQGGTMPAVLNAANEVAVAAFLREDIRFTTIPELIKKVMDQHSVSDADSLDSVLSADSWARTTAERFLREEDF